MDAHGKAILERAARMHAAFLRERLRVLGVPARRLDDAVQDVLEVLARRIEAYDARYSVRQWMAGVARNVARDDRRRANREPEPLPAGHEPPSPDDPERDAVRREACEILARFLDELDSDRWAVFVLSEIEGLRGTEIAAELGVKLSTVYARLRSAQRAFDKALTRRRARDRRRSWLAIGFGRPATSLAAVSTRVLAGIGLAVLVAVALLLNHASERDESAELQDARAEDAPAWARARIPPVDLVGIDDAEPEGEPVEATKNGVPLRGVVKDLTGGTVEDAVIIAHAGSHAAAHDGSPSTSASSAAEGTFTLSTTPGPVRLVAHAHGYAPAQAFAYAPSDGNEIVMVPGSQIRGRVLWRESGLPVEHARVSAVPADEELVTPSDALTTANGEYEIADLSAGRYTVVARVEGGVGRSARSLELGIGETARPLDVLLVRAPSVELEILYADGTPCGRGRVGLREQMRWELMRAAIEPDGLAHLQGVLPGHYTVTIECAGAVSPTHGGDLEVGEGSMHVHAHYRVERGLTLAGRLETTSGVAVAGRTIVAALTRASASSSIAVTDASGAFELTGLQPTATYAVLADGAAVNPPEISLPSAAPVDPVVLHVLDPASLRGVVSFSDGAPASGIAVSASTMSADGVRTLSDAAGRYRFDAIAPGDYRLSAETRSAVLTSSTETDPITSAVSLAPGDAVEVDLTVERCDGRIFGRIVAADGSPVADAAVGARRISGGEAATEVDERQLDAGSRSFSTLSDAEGRFTIDGLADGRYTVIAAAPDGSRATAASVGIGATIVIRMGETGNVRGTVVDADGGTPDTFVATLARSGHGMFLQELFVGTSGAWAFDDLPGGGYSIAILADDGVGRSAFSVPRERADIRIELARRGSVRGRVVNGLDGTAVSDASVFVESVEGWADALASPIYGRRVLTTADGAFVYDNPPLGVVQVRVIPSSPTAALGDNAAFVTVAPSQSASVGTIVVFPESLGNGDIGFTWAWPPLETSPYDFEYVVATVDPAGAAPPELRVGDEIVAINGHDVTDGRFLTFLRLVPPPSGTRLALTTASGRTLDIVAR